eukprot:gnl/TRDRNA2_/TRDRNA2_172934_c1_seq8.p2 gnl/TRDRNA2_/TRDRNA2_172934_c1~~gnl/TRDRNA2_/TRDRNA2_172934_c1_seq8.p2  ORF type:complete len:103 (+),score=8.98 gnl/TRDRNA2_/TRDRNA2_172934_c1_seq8:698-1006(+)
MARRHVTGLSMGAFGAWSLAFAEPEAFAAIAVVCGGLSPLMPRGAAFSEVLRLAKEPPLEDEVTKVRHIPAWLFAAARTGRLVRVARRRYTRCWMAKAVESR